MTALWSELRSSPQLAIPALLMFAIPAAFYSTTIAMTDVWVSNETFTHGFLILPISIWLIWQQRETLTDIPIGYDARALIFLLPAVAGWIVAALVDVAVVQQLAMVAVVPISVWLVAGLPLVRRLLFPLLYLFFAVPLGQSLIPPMMELTADFTVNMVQLSGIPIYRDGLSFQLPSGNWSVVEECSGVRYLIASAALGTIYAYLTYQSALKRSVFILVSLLLPIAANGLRAYGIVMIGHLSGMKYAVGADHLLYGWVFFGIVIFILFWIGGFWADPPVGAHAERSSAVDSRQQTRAGFRLATVLFVVFLSLTLGLNALTQSSATIPEDAAIDIAQSVPGWQGRNLAPSEDRWRPVVHQPDIRSESLFVRGAHEVVLDVGYYHSQRDGAEAISTMNKLSQPYGGDWKLLASRRPQGSQSPFTESELSNRGEKVLVWSGYLISGRIIASPYEAKLYQAINLLGGDTAASYVTLSTVFDDDLGTLRDRLADAWGSISDPLLDSLNEIGEQR